MKVFLKVLLVFFCCSLSGFSQSKIKEFVSLLEQQHQDPKAYILDLFKTNDIVILGERDHRDTTQYDLILDIVKDKWFVENVGHIYTEVGVINQTPFANKVVKGNYQNPEDFEKDFLELYRNIDFNALWDKYNMVKYLKGIYNINRHLEQDDKITLGLTDCAFSWKDMTHEKYTEFVDKSLRGTGTRDSIMAFNFLNLYEKQESKNGRKRALLIQSRPHAINLNVNYKDIRIKKTAAYIKEAYGDKVKVVAFNWYKWIPDEWTNKWYGPKHTIELSADGKWDAAFELTGKKSVGFNIKDTPFGLTQFDYTFEQDIKFQDVIDGMIFYLPFYEFACTRGLPNIVDKVFAKEYIKRVDIINGNNNFSKKFTPDSEVLDWADFRAKECVDYEKLKLQMNKWLEN